MIFAPLLAAGVAEDEVVDRPAQSLLGGIAEQLGRGRVPLGHALLGVHDHDRGGTDGEQRLEISALSLHLGEQPGVVDRDANVGCDRREQAGVGFAEATLLIDALDADDADRGIPHEDRHAQV